MPDLINPIFIQNELPNLSSGELPSLGELFVPEFKSNQTPDNSAFIKSLKDDFLFDPNYKKPDSLVFDSFYEKDALRYKQNERLWKEVGWNKYFPQEINDAIYDNLETKWESVSNVFPKLWYNSKFAFKNYFQSYADEVEALATLNSNALADPERFKENFEKNKYLEELYPNYQSDVPTNAFNIFRGEWWEEMTPSVGFTLGTTTMVIIF